MTPELRTVAATTFLVSRHFVSVEEIPHIGGSVLPRVEAHIPQLGMTITGPPVFFYFDFNPKADRNHLEVGFPVTVDSAAIQNLPENYQLRQTESFFCLAADYTGGMPGIQAAWSELFLAAEADELPVGVEQREVYKKWVDFESAENVTELQIEVLKAPFTE